MSESISVDKLCRLCGSESGIKINIFEPDSEYVKKIHKVLPITVNEHDPLPKHMCHRCTFKVNEFYDFRTICLKTQENLKSRIPWLQSNITGPEAVFVEEPMVQLNMNPLNIPLVDAKDNSKGDPLAIEEDCQEAMQVLEPEIVTYSMPSFIGGVNSNQNNNGSISEIEKVVIHPKNLKTSIEKRRPVVRNKLSKIWKTKKRKRAMKRRRQIHLNSKNETEFLVTSNDTLPEISKTLNVQSNDSSTHTNEHHTKTYETEDLPISDDFNGIVESRENKLPANILVTNIPRVGFVYTCENCARTFLASDSASRHICDTVVPAEIESRQNGTYNQETSDSAEYSCHLCSKIFRRLAHLQTHLRKHSEEYTAYYCDICDKKFRSEGQLDSHLQQHFNGDSPPNRESNDDSLSSWFSE